MLNHRYSLQDIAALCDVAPSTVSRVLNHRGRIAPQTRARILQVIDDLHFQPNPLARSFKNHQSQTIAVILQQTTRLGYLPLIDELTTCARQDSRLITTWPINNDGGLSQVLALLDSESVATLIVLGNPDSWLTKILPYAQKHHVIWLDGPNLQDPHIMCIHSNISTAVKLLTTTAMRNGLTPVLLQSSTTNSYQTHLIKYGFMLAHQPSNATPLIINEALTTLTLEQQITRLQQTTATPLLLIRQTPLSNKLVFTGTTHWAYLAEFPFHNNAQTIHLDYHNLASLIFTLMTSESNEPAHPLQITNLLIDNPQ